MIEKYLEAFPYSRYFISENSTYVFFLKEEAEGKFLFCSEIDRCEGLEKAKKVSDEDFSKRSYYPISSDESRNLIFFKSDEKNRENFNIYSVNYKTHKLEQITYAKYCHVHGFSDDKKTLIYGDRYKSEGGKYNSRIYRKSLESGEEELLQDDEGQTYRFTWSGVTFGEDTESLFLNVDRESDRSQGNILKIHIPTKEAQVLLPREHENPYISPLEKRTAYGKLFFSSSQKGQMNIFSYALDNGEISQLTHFKTDIKDITPLKDNDCFYLLLFKADKAATQIVKLDVKTGEISGPGEDQKEMMIPGNLFFLEGKRLCGFHTSIDSPPSLKFYTTEGEFKETMTLKAHRQIEGELVHNKYHYVEYRSFDGKKVPAYLALPKGELKGAIIISFYGGYNYYDWENEFLSELGFAILSPAVRGSFGHGEEWLRLIKGDLGGDEILDLHWGAKFLEKELGLNAHQIGLKGGSHGGYSVLRALTMPKDFRPELNCTYPYGFGICWAGFADLEDFFHTSNIPDWLVNMLGPYPENAEKYRDRSPLNHFENLNAPIFISHGENDARVSPTSMEGFLKKLAKSDKKYTLHTFKGAGHSASTKADEIEAHKKLVNFLKEVVPY